MTKKEIAALRVKCKCVAKVNKLLVANNARVPTSLFFGKTAVLVEKVDSTKRGRAPVLLASCCPFCGVRYPEESKKPTRRARKS
jgi:hypothetical protein